MCLAPIDSRLFKLLSRLDEKLFSNIEELAGFMNVSTRTIQNYVKSINEIIGGDIAEIVKVKKAGYHLIIKDKLQFESLMKNYRKENYKFSMLNTSEDRILYIMEFLLKCEDFITIDEIAYKIRIGRTTLVNDLKKLKSILKTYSIKIMGRQNSGIKLVGSELNIRFLILNHLIKSYCSNYDDEFYNEIQNKLISIFNENHFNVTDETVNKSMMYVLVSIYRISQGKFIDNVDRKYFDILNSREYKIAEKISTVVEEVSQYKMNTYETVFLTLPLLGREAPVDITNLKVASNIKELVSQIIYEVNDNFGLHMDIENEIVKNFEYHLNFMLNRLTFNIGIKNVLLDDIKRNYPLSYEMAKLSAKIIKQNYNLTADQNEMAYIALYFQSYIEQKENSSGDIEKVALVCGTGLGTAQLLKIKLNKMFSDKSIVIDTFSDSDINDSVLESYDVIFTTVNLNVVTRCPVIKVNAVFNENILKKELKKIINLKKCNVKYVENSMSILSIIIQPQFFFLLYDTDYFECLSSMLTGISQAPDIDESFKELVIMRELKSPTILGNYIAMPHAVDKKASRLYMAVGVLNKPILYDKRKVKIIILLIIPPKDKVDSDILIKAYEEILRIGQNRKIVDKLSMSKSYEDFKKILLEEVNL